MANIDCLRSTLRDRWTVAVFLSHPRPYQTQHTPQRLNFEPVLPGGNRLFLPMRGTFLLSNGAPAALRQCAWKLRNYFVNSQPPSQPVRGLQPAENCRRYAQYLLPPSADARLPRVSYGETPYTENLQHGGSGNLWKPESSLEPVMRSQKVVAVGRPSLWGGMSHWSRT